jgi:hypothetical protein
MSDQLLSDRFKRRCPYRRFLRNVYIRRLYMLTVVPLWTVLIIPVAAAKGIADELKAGIANTIKAIQDPISYD